MNALATDLFGNPIDDEEVDVDVLRRVRRAVAGPMFVRGTPEWRRAFRLQGPTSISVSGGRTSAFMLHEVLEAHDGKLPSGVVATFANTGREMPGTLDFVDGIARAWSVHIQWLEYRRDAVTGRVWSEPVSHNSASRHGEPFEAMLVEKQMLPNPVTRFCTEELKIRTMARWVKAELGWRHWTNAVGLRADEVHRAVKAGRRNRTRKERFRASCPLTRARVKERDVLQFFSDKPYDLRLQGKWEGNCDGCFLKNTAAILRMIEDYPDRMEAWAADEEEAANRLNDRIIKPEMMRYRANRPSVRNLIRYVQENPPITGARPNPARDLRCGFDASCGGGCGA